VAGCCECGDEPSGSGATELVNTRIPKPWVVRTFLMGHLAEVKTKTD
jgi:hypothetical protein